MNFQGGHLHTVWLNIVFFSYVQMNGPVNTASCIPASMALFWHIRLHPDLIFGAKFQVWIQENLKRSKAIRLFTDSLSIYVDCGHAVNSLKLQNQGLPFPVLRSGKGFGINIFSPFKSRQQKIVPHLRIPVRVDHGVMGKRHLLPALCSFLCKHPAMVKIQSFHKYSFSCFLSVSPAIIYYGTYKPLLKTKNPPKTTINPTILKIRLPPHPHKIPGQETLHSRPPQHGTYP